MKTKAVIIGPLGRMGSMLIKLIKAGSAHSALEVAGVVAHGQPNPEEVIQACDVVIDFSSPSATLPFALVCANQKKPMVIGTTGHSLDEKTDISSAVQTIPVVWASNYSTGVNTLFWLTRKAAEILGPGFDIEVVEMHHRMKKDAPSGTATTLLEILGEVRKLQLDQALRHGRKGITGERTQNEIGVHAIRGGDVVGDHTVIFAANGERVELTHKASTRETFALGALRAAKWVVGKPAGLYNMQDVLGLK